MRRARWYAAALATALALSVAGPVAAAHAERKPVLALLRALTVAPENGSGYDRELFPTWAYVGDRCDVRDLVLIDEAREGPSTGSSCPVGPGVWVSAYDGITVRTPSELDIDHMVPLAEAWGSGARRWSATVREEYANDLGYGRSLIAVTASSNRSKGDQDPAEWLPPRTSYRCTYVASWIGVKFRWGLSVDSQEEAALRVLATGCGNPRMVVPPKAR